MSVLSITFHTVESELSNWEQYVDTELIELVENLYDVEKYILSQVETEMLTEGKNTNLFLVFDKRKKTRIHRNRITQYLRKNWKGSEKR
jgi:phosphoribosylformimino-5-aminoimidazole carboxamide ribonucleotide (ProFAR) isomerase